MNRELTIAEISDYLDQLGLAMLPAMMSAGQFVVGITHKHDVGEIAAVGCGQSYQDAVHNAIAGITQGARAN